MKLTPYQRYRLKIHLKRVFNLIVIVTLITIVRLKGCQSDRPKEIQRIDDIVNGTGQTLFGVELIAYNDSGVNWILTSKRVRQDLEAKQVFIDPVHLQMFDGDGKKTTLITSDSGMTVERMDNFFVWGRVRIVDKDGTTVKTNSLSWDKDTKLLTSPDFVEIATKSGETLRGKGFEADDAFSWWEFKSEVSGEFENFDKELDGESD